MFFRVFLFLECRTISSKIPKSLCKKDNRRSSNVMLVHELKEGKKKKKKKMDFIV